MKALTWLITLVMASWGVAGCDESKGGDANGGGDGGSGGEIRERDTYTEGAVTDGDPDVDTAPICEAGSSGGEVQAPTHLMALEGQTSWYAAAIVHDLDGNGVNELIAAYYDVYVFDSDGNLLHRTEDSDEGRVYAPHVVADLDGDGIVEIAAGRGANV